MKYEKQIIFTKRNDYILGTIASAENDRHSKKQCGSSEYIRPEYLLFTRKSSKTLKIVDLFCETKKNLEVPFSTQGES